MKYRPKAEIAKDTKAVMHEQRKLYDSKGFEKYRRELIKAQEKILNEIIWYTNSNPMEYYGHMVQLQSKLRVAGQLMKDLVTRARVKYPNATQDTE